MKRANIMVYPKELVYQIYTNTRLQCVTWGGVCLNYRNDSLNINNTFFHYDIRAG